MNSIEKTASIDTDREWIPTLPLEKACSINELESSIQRFVKWLGRAGYTSYDPYDVWGTQYGKFARRLYYKKNAFGVALTAPVILMEVILPHLRAAFVRKDRYPTADAQLALAFLNLYEVRQSAGIGTHFTAEEGPSAEAWLTKAKDLADDLLTMSVPGYSGFCWGYPFDWQNVNGLMPKQTPHITATPYCYEVFTRLYELTGEERYLRVAESITEFVFTDLKDTPTGENAAASSYTPFDQGKVVNASAYRAFLLIDAAHRFQRAELREKAWKNLRFILDSQRPDGSWLYAIDNPAETFIDHFHTCFVLKNLYKINLHLQAPEVRRAMQLGYDWYRRALFDEKGNPRSFAAAPRLQIVHLEMYNFAETVTLGVLLKNDIPEALQLAETLASRLIRQYQLPSGHWVTRVYRGGMKHRVPFLRWPQSQLFLALTNLLVAKGVEDRTTSRKFEDI